MAEKPPKMSRTGNAASAWGVHKSTLRRWAKRGQVEGAVKTKGGHWRIPTDSLPKSGR